MVYEFLFLKALALTCSSELAAGVVFMIMEAKFKFFREKVLSKIPWPKFVILVIFASAMTLPYVWFVFTLIKSRLLFLMVAELFAWLMEAFFYKYCFNLKIHQALVFAFVLNLFSFLLGLIIF